MNKIVPLPEDLADAIEAKVTAGQYGSPGDVVRDALHLLDERDRGNETRRQDLRGAWQESLASGDAGEIDFSALKARGRRAIRAGELTGPEIALIARAEVPAEHAHLDEELKDWRP